jgi:hypothetical protein
MTHLPFMRACIPGLVSDCFPGTREILGALREAWKLSPATTAEPAVHAWQKTLQPAACTSVSPIAPSNPP